MLNDFGSGEIPQAFIYRCESGSIVLRYRRVFVRRTNKS